jgi:hypothetical protein
MLFWKNLFFADNLYKSIVFWDIKSIPNYTEKLIFTGIATTPLSLKFFWMQILLGSTLKSLNSLEK